ncbi:MAG: hypothetical protein V3V08_12305 [Nannocystaceae bacterium]
MPPVPNSASSVDPHASLLDRARAALDDQDGARAAALLGRVLTSDPEPDMLRAVYAGLAHAHELLRDCRAAIRAYEAYLQHFADANDRHAILSRRGACEAEIGAWERSASSYRGSREGRDLPPSAMVEALAREGYARFQFEQFEQADVLLAEAGAVYERSQEQASERFATYYFVGMARFYRAAILHRAFREQHIRAGRQEMDDDYQRKLELLLSAQDAYKDTIKLKHVFWVSAAGFQWGSMFAEFYDALMYAPVPEWLDGEQRKVYFEALKAQIRPIMNDAIWVFEKNLEVARKLGYENRFIERSQLQLNGLQRLLLAGDALLGMQHPRVAPISEADGPTRPEDLFPAAQRHDIESRLFVPAPTPL